MFEVKDVGKLLDEVLGCSLLADDDQIVDVTENGELLAYPNASITFKLFKMQLCKCWAQMFCQSFGAVRKPYKALLRRQMMLASWMKSHGGTTKISVVMGVFKKADDTSQDVACQL